jgi:L-lactate dehydrogenase complex protein LldF
VSTHIASPSGNNGMLHREYFSGDDPHGLYRDGHRFDHTDASSKSLQPEKQPRGAKIRASRLIDQAEAAARFIASPEHAKMHDDRLWNLRQKRDREMCGSVEWEELRSVASAIKEHSLAHVAQYLEQFCHSR